MGLKNMTTAKRANKSAVMPMPSPMPGMNKQTTEACAGGAKKKAKKSK